MHANAELLKRFYEAFHRRDWAAMQACYAPKVDFQDAVFTLTGREPHAMWHMLCVQAKELRVEARDFVADDREGSAHWEAWYPFSATGRKVHNVIEAKVRFEDGLIVWHRDSFGLYPWMKQALGPAGALLGWAPPVQALLKRQAYQGLRKFMAKEGGY